MSRPGKPARSYQAPQREAAALRTRETVLTAAATLFAERGFAGTTIQAVAGEARVSPKTIEAAFGT